MNIHYPDSTDYTNLAKLWLQVATDKDQETLNEKDQEIATQSVLDKTTEFTNRIKNIDESISHEEVCHICDRILGEFNKLSPQNRDSIAKYVATLDYTGYEHLHKLFQTIGDTQHLPNYFDPPAPPKNLIDVVIDKSLSIFDTLTNFNRFNKKISSAEGIVNLGIKAREFIDQRMTLFGLFEKEKGLQKQILSNLDEKSRAAVGVSSKKGLATYKERIVELMNAPMVGMKLKINSIEALIDYLGPENCKQVKRLKTFRFLESGVSKNSLAEIQRAFPNLVELNISKLDNNVLVDLKNFKSLKVLSLAQGTSEQIDAAFLPPHLSNLKLIDFYSLTTINNAEHLASLSKLELFRCQKLDMNFAKEIPNLTNVSIFFADNSNLSGLANNPYISHLRLHRYSSNFDFLLEMPALKQLTFMATWMMGEQKQIKQKLLKNGIAKL